MLYSIGEKYLLASHSHFGQLGHFKKEVVIFTIITLDGRSSGSCFLCDDNKLCSKDYFFNQ